jgi:hypothetical protein
VQHHGSARQAGSGIDVGVHGAWLTGAQSLRAGAAPVCFGRSSIAFGDRRPFQP